MPQCKRIKQHVRSLATIHDLLTQQAKRDANTVRCQRQRRSATPDPHVAGDQRGQAHHSRDRRLSRFPCRKPQHCPCSSASASAMPSNTRREKWKLLLRLRGTPHAWKSAMMAQAFRLASIPARLPIRVWNSLTAQRAGTCAAKLYYENREQGGGRVVVTFPIDAPSEP